MSDPGVVRRVYDTVAASYAEKFVDDLRRIPFDRERVDELAAAAGRGAVVDLACGPGHVTAHLRSQGLDAVGVDLSPAMVAEARRRDDRGAYVAGDLRSLPFADRAFVGGAAFYCLLYFTVDELAPLFRELSRVLRVGAPLLVATHLGDGEIDGPTEFLGHAVESVRATLFRRGEIEAALARAGFRIDVVQERGPLEYEAQTQRVYVLARRG